MPHKKAKKKDPYNETMFLYRSYILILKYYLNIILAKDIKPDTSQAQRNQS